jgi:hypothetical protein
MSLPRSITSATVKPLFFSNQFYGICAVALSMEAGIQQGFALNDALFYLLLYATVVVYYNKAYLFTEHSRGSANVRVAWYARNRRALRISQFVFIGMALAAGFAIFAGNRRSVLDLAMHEWGLLGIFPLVSAAYYGFSFGKHAIVLRNVGWLKPFIIGFSWAGMVTVYPVLYYRMTHGDHYEPTVIGALLFIKNLMFVAVLCIMFDIKDYAMDYNLQLKTFVVKIGLRRTIYYVIIPLCAAGLAFFVAYAIYRGFHPLRITFNVIPFLAAIAVGHSLHLRRSILYYLVIIDGLMLLKAVCGITGYQFD